MRNPEGLGIPSELELRQELLQRLEGMEPELAEETLAMFDEYKGGFESSYLKGCLIRSINKAELSDHWGHGDEVMIGYYQNTSTYFSLMLHECGHDVLRQLGKPAEERYDWEEDFCHRFSRRMCQAMGVTYNDRLEQVSRQFFLITRAISRREGPRDQLINELDVLAMEQEAVILRFSPPEVRCSFTWDERKVPVMA